MRKQLPKAPPDLFIAENKGGAFFMIQASINTVFLQSIVDEDKLTELAVFMKLKSLFSNSCIFNATYSNISRKSGISVSVLKRCIPTLKALGWVRMSGSNMVFEKMRVIDNTPEYTKRIVLPFKILDKDGYKAIVNKLKLILIRLRQDAFEFIKALSNDNTKGFRVKSFARLKRKFLTKKNIGENEKFSISNRTVAKIINKSKSSASRLMKWGKENGILNTTANISATSQPNGFIPEDFRKAGFFKSSKCGFILRQKPNYVHFY